MRFPTYITTFGASAKSTRCSAQAGNGNIHTLHGDVTTFSAALSF
ncbi:hypothetical protein O2K51_03065 [Apibacter raozihei]|nr:MULTISPECIES: hypothetical protein [Apibacter]